MIQQMNGQGNKTEYSQFLAEKQIVFKSSGIEIFRDILHDSLFEFQKDLVQWALRKGRAAIFADTGLGKTRMQVEWARLVSKNRERPVLIVAPLSVARQTVRESKQIGVEVVYQRDGTDPTRITITNYEMLDHFNADDFCGVVLDESSILKSIDGKTRQKLIEMFKATPYKLACTATPAPNDIAEIANHAEFLSIMTRTEMLSAFFVHDDNGWRLKGHAKDAFYKWLASWGMSIKMPSDLGYEDNGFILPSLDIKPEFVQTDYRPEGQLFFTKMNGISDRSIIRKATASARCARVAELVNSNNDQWIVWCGLNNEADIVASLIDGAENLQGSDSIERKISVIEDFQDGKIRVLVTKPKIAGMGMNFQQSHNMAFVGLSDSWESYYQCIRRQYRFGQVEPVNVRIVLSDIEQVIYQNILKKEEQAKIMTEELIKNVQQYEQEEIAGIGHKTWEYTTDEMTGEGWRLLMGDSVERMKELDDESIDLSVFSPPFASLYTYSPSERDLGNASDDDEFFKHFAFIIKELLRITKPGRIAAVHVADVPAMLVRDGYIGLKDFSGDVIREFIKYGWIFDSRIPIDKNQQAQSIRTHAKGLTMTQMEKDRTWSRPALPDYILKFRKPGENAVPVRMGNVDRELWIEYANPTWPGANGDRCADMGAMATWYGIKESDTLQGWQRARGNDDERHICPLQLGTIERVIKLWSNSNEVIFSPFAGIGSEGHEAIRLGRQFVGIELKPEYWREAVKNLQRIEQKNKTIDLFSYAGIAVEKQPKEQTKEQRHAENLKQYHRIAGDR